MDVVPLADWVDHPRPGSVAVAVEMDAEGAIYPAVYVAPDGDVHEHVLPPDHRNNFEGDEYRRELEELL
jgi:hypothetical protein